MDPSIDRGSCGNIEGMDWRENFYREFSLNQSFFFFRTFLTNFWLEKGQHFIEKNLHALTFFFNFILELESYYLSAKRFIHFFRQCCWKERSEILINQMKNEYSDYSLIHLLTLAYCIHFSTISTSGETEFRHRCCDSNMDRQISFLPFVASRLSFSLTIAPSLRNLTRSFYFIPNSVTTSVKGCTYFTNVERGSMRYILSDDKLIWIWRESEKNVNAAQSHSNIYAHKSCLMIANY